MEYLKILVVLNLVAVLDTFVYDSAIRHTYRAQRNVISTSSLSLSLETGVLECCCRWRLDWRRGPKAIAAFQQHKKTSQTVMRPSWAAFDDCFCYIKFMLFLYFYHIFYFFILCQVFTGTIRNSFLSSWIPFAGHCLFSKQFFEFLLEPIVVWAWSVEMSLLFSFYVYACFFYCM